MNEEHIDKLLYQVRDSIKINEEFKGNLRKSFKKRRVPIWKNIWVYSAVAAMLIISLLVNNFQSNQVLANSLKITNSLSFFKIGSGEFLNITHKNGQLFVLLRNKGIYVYDEQELKKVSGEIADHMAVAASGEKILISSNGNIAILNLNTNKSETIIPKTSSTQYGYPVWKDNQHIFVTKNQQEIVQFNLQTGGEKVIANGSRPSYIDEEQILVFERNQEIITKNLKNDKETVIDEGTEPVVSADGQYIAYVKAENGVQNVWVSDVDGQSQKKVTTNPIDEQINSLYEYSSPIWSTVDQSIYVIKKEKNTDNQQAQIMKIDLGEKELDAKQTVERFLQALIVRDDDYARSFMEKTPDILTISNPHQTGYHILTSEEKNGLTYVTAEMMWSYTANAYSKLTTYEFELKQDKNGYVITNVQELNSIELTLDSNNRAVQFSDGASEQTLFTLDEVPTEHINSTNFRISSLVLDKQNEKVIFTIQEMEDETHQAAVQLFSYEMKNKTFEHLSQVSINGEEEIGISEISIDESGRYVALDVFLDTPPFTPSVVVYDIQQKKQIAEYEQTHSIVWKEKQLLMQTSVDEQLTIIKNFESNKE